MTELTVTADLREREVSVVGMATLAETDARVLLDAVVTVARRVWPEEKGSLAPRSRDAVATSVFPVWDDLMWAPKDTLVMTVCLVWTVLKELKDKLEITACQGTVVDLERGAGTELQETTENAAHPAFQESQELEVILV